MRFNPFRRRDDDGSIAIFMVTVLVTTGLVMITAKTVESGMRSSRRGGDSANALQVADAGINDAVTAIQTAGSSTFTRSGTVGNGSYEYTAVQDAGNPENWLIDVYGTDKTGVRRHVRATASGEPIFASPMYINTSMTANAGGILDSYTSGHSLAGPTGIYKDGGCTDKGIMFFDPDASLTFQSGSGGGGGTSVNNCNKMRFGNTWDFSMDGCIVYGGVMTLPNTAFGSGKCPNPSHATYPNRSKAITQTYEPPVIKAPLRSKTSFPTQGSCPSTDPDCAAIPGASFTCNASSGNNSLKAGKVYYYSSITLSNGCGIDLSTIPSNANPEWVAQNAVELYTTSLLIDARTQGAVNMPPVASRSALCGSSTTSWSYVDINKNPAWYYCTGWVRGLSLNLLTGSGSKVTIRGNNGKFWGTFAAPDSSVSLEAPGMEFWGAMLAGNLQVKNQFSWHYDDTLGAKTTGKYTIRNWREEPL